MKRHLLRAIFAAGVALAVELVARGGLWLLESRGVRYEPILADRLSSANVQAIEGFLAGKDSAFQLDPVLGWTLRPGFQSKEISIDAEGRRRAPDRPAPETGAKRIAAFGDSFTFGGDVADRGAWVEVLARLDPGVDVANYGVPAYGLDQAYLRYLKEREKARAEMVLIGYLSENICRNVSVFRPFYNPGTAFPLAKPRYLPEGEGLHLLDNPLPSPESYRRLVEKPAEVLAEMGRHDTWFRQRSHASAWDRSATVRVVKMAAEQLRSHDRCYGDAEAFAVTTRLFDLFHETVIQDGAKPVILIFPTRGEVVAWRSSRKKRYTPLLRFLESKGFRVVDLMEIFDGAGREYSVEELIPSHLSPLGNELVAEQLRRYLQGRGLLSLPDDRGSAVKSQPRWDSIG